MIKQKKFRFFGGTIHLKYLFIGDQPPDYYHVGENLYIRVERDGRSIYMEEHLCYSMTDADWKRLDNLAGSFVV